GAVNQSVIVTKAGTNATAAKSRRARGDGGRVGTGQGGGIGGSTTPAPPPKPSPNKSIVMMDGREADAVRVLSPEEQKRADMQTKLHPSILKVIEWLKDPKAGALSDEAKFVRDGKAEIQIFLNEKSDATMAELKRLGFEVVLDPKTAKMVIGRLPIDKLAALAELKSVRYVAPQISN